MKLYPDAYISSLTDAGPEFFKEKGIQGLILDLDNTIIAWKAGVFQPDMVSLLKSYKKAGLKLCVVSNALNKRATNLLEPLRIPWVARAGKPSRRPFLKALAILETDPDRTAVIGDQLFTDVLGGKRMGLYTVLVVPISKKEFIGTKCVRLVEKVMLHRMAKKGIIDFPGGTYDQR